MTRPADLRLVGPAIGTWGGAVLGNRLAIAAALLACAVTAPIACWLVSRRRTCARLVGVSLLCAAAGLTVASARAPATAGVLQEVAQQRSTMTVDGVITDDPQLRQPRRGRTRRGGALILVAASAHRIQFGARTFALRAPVLVIAHSSGWAELLPSQSVRFVAVAAPPRRGDHVALALFAHGAPMTTGGPSSSQRIAGVIRAGLRDASAALPADAAGLLPGLVDGDTRGLSQRVRDEFRITGLTHLVAVSGANVAIVAAAAGGLARAMWLGLRARTVFAAASVIGFVVLARPSPSVLRAALMGLVGLAALATGRRRAGVPALAAAVITLVLAAPSLATSDGFALSVLATSGLLFVAPRLRDRFIRRLPQWAADSLAVAVAAQVMTTPYIALRFARVSLLSIPANLLAAAAVPPATVLGVVAAALAPVCLPLAQITAWMAFLPTEWLIGVARGGAAVPGASVGWPRGWPGFVAAGGCGVAVVLLRCVPRWRRGHPLRSTDHAGRR